MDVNADRRLLVVLAAVAVPWVVALVMLLDLRDGLVDLQVYRTAGEAWLRGLPLYDAAFPWQLPGPQLPFTYPPVAAVLFAALTVLPWWIAVGLVIGSGVAALTFACWLASARLFGAVAASPRFGAAALLAAGAVAAAPLIEPVRQTVSFGQINLLLLGAIAADCLLRRTPWPRGMLIGVVAAIKLTPAAFVLYFLARRQWRPALVAAVTFVAVALLGLALAPGDTSAYWFGALLDPTRIGHVEFASNQSLRGLLERFGLPPVVDTAVWLGLSAVVVLLALLAVAALRRQGDDVAALLVTAAAALLVSPVSWSHHWVWAVLGLLWLGHHVARARTPLSLGLLAGTLAVFVASPFWWLPYRDQRELSWSAGQHLLGNAYVWVALAAVLAGTAVAIRARRTTGDEPLVPANSMGHPS